VTNPALDPARAFVGAPCVHAHALGFRPIHEGDLEFLCALYASTRADELAPVPWSAPEKEAFLRAQFGLQHRYYQQTFVQADYLLVICADERIGRVYVTREHGDIDLIDIALLPAWRGRGIGTALLRELVAESERTRRDIVLHVEPNNPAKRLYARCGFALVENRGVYDFLRRTPQGAVSSE